MLTLVFAFQTSAALAFAFGMAVTGAITITTLLSSPSPARECRHHPVALVLWRSTLLTVDLLLLAANLTGTHARGLAARY